MINKKRLVSTVGAMALTAVIAVGGTLAYLSSVTETKKNTFTSSKNISTELIESEWNENSGSDYTPGKVINKNPVMRNEGTEGIWTAVKIDYVGSANQFLGYDAFKNYASTDGFNENWVKMSTNADGSEVWLYNKVLAEGSSTEAIFNQVTVNAGIEEEWTAESKITKVYTIDENGNKILVNTEITTYDPTINYYDENGNKISKPAQLPAFEIRVTGFAIQASELTAEDGTLNATGKMELIKLINDKSDSPFTIA